MTMQILRLIELYYYIMDKLFYPLIIAALNTIFPKLT